MCKLCDKYNNYTDIVMENETCFAVNSENPTSIGHMLILPKNHKKSFFDLTYKEHEDMNMLLRNCKAYLDSRIEPDGYNIGFNDGEWAGQTINHCVAHLIPRFAGDVPATELKGGIKNFKKNLERT